MKRIAEVLLLGVALLAWSNVASATDAVDDAALRAELDMPAADDPERGPVLDIFQCLARPPKENVGCTYPPPPPVQTPPLVEPPVRFSVRAVAMEGSHCQAVLFYDGADHLVETGWESSDGAFVVKKIAPAKDGEIQVVIFKKKASRLARASLATAAPASTGYGAPGD